MNGSSAVQRDARLLVPKYAQPRTECLPRLLKRRPDRQSTDTVASFRPSPIYKLRSRANPVELNELDNIMRNVDLTIWCQLEAFD